MNKEICKVLLGILIISLTVSSGSVESIDPVTGNPNVILKQTIPPLSIIESIAPTLTIVNFDDIQVPSPPDDEWIQIIDYAGITWDSDLPDHGGSRLGGWGVTNLEWYADPQSPPNLAFNSYGAINPGFNFSSPVRFNGAFFFLVSSGANPEAVRLVGYVGSTPTYYSSWLPLPPTPIYLNADFPPVDRVVVEMDGPGWFGMDDLSYGEMSNGADVSVDPPSQDVSVGQTFTINITVDPHGDQAAGAQFDLRFNPDMLTVNSVIEGDFLRRGGPTFFNPGTVDNDAGIITNVYGALLAAGGVADVGTFATISMTVNSAGFSNIDLSNVVISRPDGSPMSVSVHNGVVQVPVYVRIVPSELSVIRGRSFAVNITVDPNGYDVAGIQSDLIYNFGSPLLSTTGVVEGNFLRQGGTTFFNPGTIDNPNGIVDNIYGAIVTPGGRATLPGIFATISMNPDNPGGTDLRLEDVIVSDIAGLSLPARVTGGHVDIIACDAVWDVNRDGITNIQDVVIVGQHFGERTTPPYPAYDVNADGIVNVQDIVIIGQHFGERTCWV